MNDDRAFILGFTSFAFAMYLGSEWSPDYKDLINDGSNFLAVAFFGIIIMICMSFIDYYYKRKHSKIKKDKVRK